MQTQSITQTDQTAKTFLVSLFSNKTDKWPKREDWAWEELVRRVRAPEIRAEKDGALFSGARYRAGATRGGEGVDENSLLPLDYDHGADFDRDCAIWESLGYSFVAYTTHSSYRVTENNPEAEERFRIVLPLAAPIPAAQYLALWLWAQAMSGGRLDNAPKNAASIFYAPAVVSADAQYKLKIHNGRLLDWREIELAEPKANKEPESQSAARITANGHVNGHGRADDLVWLIRPGDDYDSRPDAFEKSRALLTEENWTYFGDDPREGGQFWARPGVTDHHGARLRPDGSLYVWTSNAPPLLADESYTAFQLRALLRHSGNFTAAASALATEGYGVKREEKAKTLEQKTDPAPEPTEETEAGNAIDTVFDDANVMGDHGNTARFLNKWRHVTRYVYKWKKFMSFDRGRWTDDQGVVEDRVNRIVQELRDVKGKTIEQEQSAFKFYVKSQAPERRNAMLALARAEIRIEPDTFDADPELFNTADGTVHLPTGQLRSHNPRDYCSKISKVKFDPKAKCPLWTAFLLAIFNDDQELIAFIQRAVGYSLSGLTIEQVLFLLYGIGKNGKSTFVNVLLRLMGEYATSAQMEVFAARKRAGNGHSEDLANLYGARIVTAVETEESKRLSEGLIKQITGCDPITASRKHEHSFTFTPVLKLWLAANHKPIIRGTDDGIWRRPLLVPFLVQFEVDPNKRKAGEREGDPKLQPKLFAELPGILNWALEGFRDWNGKGLRPPDSVRAATQQYREDSDLIGNFIEESLDRRKPLDSEPRGEQATEIFKAWCAWCADNGEYAGAQTSFGNRMVERGFENCRDSKSGKKIYPNVFLKPGARAPQKGLFDSQQKAATEQSEQSEQ